MLEESIEQGNIDRKQNIYATLGFGFVCLLVGLPLWWKTTEVYRVALPYSDIEDLASSQFEYVVELEVVSYDESLVSPDLASLSKQLMDGLSSREKSDVRPRYRTSVREKTEKEDSILKSSKTVYDLDNRLASLAKGANVYFVNLLPASSHLQLSAPTLGTHRNLYITRFQKDIPPLSADIIEIVRGSLVREGSVIKGYNSAKGARNKKPDKETLRSVRSHPGYDITITLVNPRPDIIDAQWEIKGAVDTYLQPLIDKMDKYTKISIKSQVLYFTKLLTKPKRDWQKHDDEDEYYFTKTELPHMINPLEAKLGSPASTNPELNFLVYVPSKDQYPLYIRDDDEQNIPTNSFLSPQWGGILIYNIPLPQPNDTLPIRPSVDMKRVMEVFVAQLRLLLNLHVQGLSNKVQFLPVGNNAVTEWEVDSWLRSRCVENLATATATLKSLAQLLGQINNIVINDDIGKEVELAVQSVRDSDKLLKEGRLEEAFLSSRSAIVASETAFFHPSLLELLYFPEDQKFAIYIPLFLPISFPVLASLFQAYKWYKNSKKPKQD